MHRIVVCRTFSFTIVIVVFPSPFFFFDVVRRLPVVVTPAHLFYSCVELSFVELLFDLCVVRRYPIVNVSTHLFRPWPQVRLGPLGFGAPIRARARRSELSSP